MSSGRKLQNCQVSNNLGLKYFLLSSMEKIIKGWHVPVMWAAGHLDLAYFKRLLARMYLTGDRRIGARTQTVQPLTDLD